MGEAKKKDAKKTVVKTISFTEGERFQLLIWWNNVVQTKSHQERRQLNRFFDALSLDDFPLDTPVNTSKLDKEKMVEYQVDGGMLDYMDEQLKKEAPAGIGIYTQRVIADICDLVKATIDGEPEAEAETPKPETEAA